MRWRCTRGWEGKAESEGKSCEGAQTDPQLYSIAATAPTTAANAPPETIREEAPLVEDEVELAAELDPVLVAEVDAEPEREEADPEAVAATLAPEAVVEAAEEAVAAPEDCSAKGQLRARRA